MRSVLRMTACLLCGVSTLASAGGIDRRLAAAADGEVEIVNVAGDVKVIGWERAEVRVQADLSRDDEELEFTSDASHTSIKVVARGRNRPGGADLIVHVPRASALSTNTVSADQSIKEVRGAQRLQAVSGTIATELWTEELEAKTVSGHVHVQGHGSTAAASVTTVSGSIALKHVAGEISLNTVTGDMDVSAEQLTRTRIRTTNGSLALRAQFTPEARVDAEAVNGDLRFMLRGEIDAQFDVETFNGEIDNCFGVQAVRTREFAPGRALRFKRGAGSARVRIKTLNGGVEICKVGGEGVKR